MESDRYSRGLQKLKEIDGHAGERVIEALKGNQPSNLLFIYSATTKRFHFLATMVKRATLGKLKFIPSCLLRMKIFRVLKNCSPMMHSHLEASTMVGAVSNKSKTPNPSFKRDTLKRAP